MPTGVARTTLTISDLHLGDGSVRDSFKRHKLGNDIYDLSEDEPLDSVFVDFISWATETFHGTELTLRLLGDTFDPLVVELDGMTELIPYEEYDLKRFEKICEAHWSCLEALKKFCAEPGFKLIFHQGNHDWFLWWPGIQKKIREIISPSEPERISFTYDELDDGIYYWHGNTELHDLTDPGMPIIRQKDFPELLHPKRWKKLIERGMTIKEILNVPLSHYMAFALKNPLKSANYLIDRVRNSSMVYRDAFFRIFARPWYKRRLFSLLAPYYTLRVIFMRPLFAILTTLNESLIRKILRIVKWTMDGVLLGHEPRDFAKAKLQEAGVEVVVLGHDHLVAEELHRIGNKNKKYFNTGTWTEMWEAKAIPETKRWKRFGRIQRIIHFFRNFFHDISVVPITTFPVLVANHTRGGNRSVNLLRFDPETKELKEIV